MLRHSEHIHSNPKIQIVIHALQKITKSGRFATESNGLLNVAIQNLGMIAPDNYLLDKEIAIYLLGALITALAFSQLKYRDGPPNLRDASVDMKSKFYGKPLTSHGWANLEQPLVDGKLDKSRFITNTGSKILEGVLDFEKEKLSYLFPFLAEHFEVAAQMILGNTVAMPAVIKPYYKKSVVEIKAKMTALFTPYYDNFKIHLFGYGPHHKTRAKQVLASIHNASDIKTILDILENQKKVLQNNFDAEMTAHLKLFAGLDERWTTPDRLKNKTINRYRSGYYDILESSTKFIDACVGEEDLYHAVTRTL